MRCPTFSCSPTSLQDCNARLQLIGVGLRPYQKEAVEAICKEWSEGHQHTLLVLPTGTGKTVVFAKVVELKVGEGKHVGRIERAKKEARNAHFFFVWGF